LARLIEQSKYLAWFSILSLLLASICAFLWGTVKAVEAVALVVTSLGQDPFITFSLIQLVDIFLIAITLFILAVSIYQLFIGKLDLPDWMLASNLSELKGSLSSVLILVMAVKFVEKLVESEAPQSLLLQAVAVTIVSAMLIAFNYFKKD
jgi:uncharacterized membrane protein YqhA